MPKKLIIYPVVLVAILSFSVISGFSQILEEEGCGPVLLTLQSRMANKPAVLAHRKHQKMYKCGLCHHGKDADGNQTPYREGMEIGKCESCHNSSMPLPTLNEKEYILRLFAGGASPESLSTMTDFNQICDGLAQGRYEIELIDIKEDIVGEAAQQPLNSYQKAAHVLCQGCHRIAKKEGKPAPTKCTGCHVKKK
jgi:hypothetical protein